MNNLELIGIPYFKKGSGIYDVFDTYDFRKGISNRKPGYQIEIRDTIHGPNAKPELYDKTFSTKKRSN